MTQQIGLCVLTYKPVRWVERLIESIRQQTLRPDKLLVVDTESEDRSSMRFQSIAAEIYTVNPRDFDHGGTRQLGLSECRPADVIVFMTQDAIIAESDSLEKLVRAFDDERVGAAYGRQLPRKDANPIEEHARIFNYPPESQFKCLEDSERLGIKTCFLSNSFAAYRRSALEEVGGFPKKNIVSEDTYVSAKMLEAGWMIKYCADATIYHSHNYSMFQEVQRYFDLGVFHSREPWIRSRFGQAEGEGKRFVLSQLNFLLKKSVLLIPSVLLRTIFKYVGFLYK